MNVWCNLCERCKRQHNGERGRCSSTCVEIFWGRSRCLRAQFIPSPTPTTTGRRSEEAKRESEINVTGRGHFTGKIIRIDLHRLWMQRFSDNLPRVGHSATMAGRAIFTFRTEPGPSLLAGGMEMQPTSIMRHSEGQNYHRRSAGFASYGSMSLPVEEMAAVGEAMAAVDLTPPRDAMLITPPPAAMTRLQRLHAAAGHLAENAPEMIAHPEAARGLEQLLIHALVECLSLGEASEDRSALRRHATIMRRFRRAVEETPDQALYIPELSKAIGVSDRTLRGVLPGAAWDEPQAIFAVAPDASRTASPARRRS